MVEKNISQSQQTIILPSFSQYRILFHKKTKMQFTATLAALASFTIVNASPLSLPFSRQTSNITNVGNCGNQTYNPAMYKCWPGSILCPTMNGTETLPCATGNGAQGFDCYLPSQYTCVNATLLSLPSPMATNGTNVTLNY
ncbi:hypothetical protein L873DRAFT_1799989 [Choiromyces venosus 120613-1]|uniref:Endo-1,3(4)-beta-glucanase 1 carbohydrate binding domain-containing protein n=1 Tax=Choiromyces venosus 120613-1 TaxID=1336337 RepID=A0A3N4K014_9PEZI|nr:hypothetical protein L873DRAFT_1799989 [Choiromyces venosus 120613-1]